MKFYQISWTGTVFYNVRAISYRDGFPKRIRGPGRRKWKSLEAQALITGHDILRTKYVHQVTTCCLKEILQTQGSSGASFFGKDI